MERRTVSIRRRERQASSGGDGRGDGRGGGRRRPCPLVTHARTLSPLLLDITGPSEMGRAGNHRRLRPGFYWSSAIFFLEKILSVSLNFRLNFRLNPFFFPRPQNQLFRLLELPKSFVRHHLSGFRMTWQQFSLFLLYLFWLNLWKIILNHKKS